MTTKYSRTTWETLPPLTLPPLTLPLFPTQCYKTHKFWQTLLGACRVLLALAAVDKKNAWRQQCNLIKLNLQLINISKSLLRPPPSPKKRPRNKNHKTCSESCDNCRADNEISKLQETETHTHTASHTHAHWCTQTG